MITLILPAIVAILAGNGHCQLEMHLRAPEGSILVEAESFDQTGQWHVSPTRSESAAWGLSGGLVLGSNQRDAVATKTVDLPDGEWNLWVRVADWAGAPGHYEFTLSINGEPKQIAITEPIAVAHVWERWATVPGGQVDIELSNPDSFNACLDCLLFVRDGAYVPPLGPEAEIARVEVDGELPAEPVSLRVELTGEDLPEEVSVAVVRTDNARPGRRDLIWFGESDPAEIALPSLPYIWPGDYSVLVGVANTSLAIGEEVLTFRMEATAMVEPVRAEIRNWRGSPTVHINGKPDFAFAYLNHVGDRDRYYSQMAEAGVRFLSLGGGIGATPEGFDPTGCDAPFLEALRQQPEALMFPRVGVTAPEWWLEEHPDQRVVFDDGTTGPQSMFSEAWLEAACEWIEDYSRYIRNSPYADHVMGIHICSGVSAEWQSWGLWSDQRGVFSAPALQAWREYLDDKYETDDALSEAWGRDASLAGAQIPTRERREINVGRFRMPGEHQDIIDFYDYYWRGTSRAIQALAAAAKRGGGRDWLVGFFYGYAMQYGGKMQESQHLGMGEVMRCPDIDYFCSPAMYSQRQPGGTSTFMSYTESLKRHGKIWFHEADSRTHLSADRLSAAEDLPGTLSILKREFAHVVARQAGVWWFDMQGGWYDDPDVMALLGEMREFGETNDSRWRPKAEIAVFVDDKSSYRLAPESPYLNRMTQVIAELSRLGAPHDTYLLSDISQASRYRMIIFPLALDLTGKERAAINRLKAEGRTLVFLGDAGIGRYKGGRVEHDPALSEALLGIEPTGDGWQHVDHGSWRMSWTPTAHPKSGELRRIARRAGVHLYHERGDALYAGNGIIALHGQTDGTKTLRFREIVRIREVFAEAPLTAEADEITFELAAGETRCFAVYMR